MIKRFYGILVVILLLAGLVATLRLRNRWVNETLDDSRARTLRQAEPHWPDLNTPPHTNRPVQRGGG